MFISRQCFKVFHFRVCHTQVLAEGFFSHFRSCNLVNGFVYSSSLCSAVGISMQDKARHLFITFKLQLQLQYLVYEIEKKFVPVIAKKKKWLKRCVLPIRASSHSFIKTIILSSLCIFLLKLGIK